MFEIPFMFGLRKSFQTIHIFAMVPLLANFLRSGDRRRNQLLSGVLGVAGRVFKRLRLPQICDQVTWIVRSVIPNGCVPYKGERKNRSPDELTADA